jgi:uncharacterized damage-inducible protein DinB
LALLALLAILTETMSTSPNLAPTSATDKEKLLALLRESRKRFLGSFAGMADEQCRQCPGEGRWSILDTVEHLTVAETFMLKLVKDTRRPKARTSPNREEFFLHALTNRRRKLESPEAGRPLGRFANLDEAAKQFDSARDGAIEFVEQCREDLRATEVTHPHPAAGVVSTYEMLIIMAKHAERHALQIEETKSVLGL